MDGKLPLAGLMILLFIGLTASSQGKFRVKNVSGLEFMLPPHGKIAKEGIFNYKRTLTFQRSSRFRFQYFIVKGLSTSYNTSVTAIANAIYYRSRHKMTQYLNKITNGTAIKIDEFANYYISEEDHANLAIEIDLDALIADETKGTLTNYSKLKDDLWMTFDKLADRKWATSIAMDLSKGFFSLFPIPQEQVLNRYLAKNDAKASFCLLTPEIWLALDVAGVLKDQNPAQVPMTDKDFWIFNFERQILLTFSRDDNGLILQSPFLHWTARGDLPADYLDSNKRVTLQASTSDIQTSSALAKAIYVSFFQNSIRTNNKADDEFKLQHDQKGNSELLFFDHISGDLLKRLNNHSPTLGGADIHESMFGLRDPIDLYIPVFVNGFRSIPIRLNATIKIVKQENIVPPIKKLQLFRTYKGEYRKVKFYNDNTILLPADRLTYPHKN